MLDELITFSAGLEPQDGIDLIILCKYICVGEY